MFSINIRMMLLLGLLCNIACLLSCTGRHYNNNEIVAVSYTNNINQIKLTDLKIFEIEYISLETNERSMFSGIDVESYKVIMNSEAIYIKDNNNRRILKFDSVGKYLTPIGKNGHGPDEYLYINDFSIDNGHNRIAILSLLQDKIFLYNLEGDFLKVISCPKDITHIFCTEGNILCYKRNTGTNRCAFDLLDYDGNIIKSFVNKYQYSSGKIIFVKHENECLHYYKKDTLYIKERYCDTIFRFANLQFEPYLVLDRGDKRYKTESLIFNSEDEMMNAVKLAQKNYIDEFNLIEFDNQIYTNLLNNDSTEIFVASKNDNSFSSASYNLIKNNIDGGPDVFILTSKDDKTLVSYINPLELKTHIHTEYFINNKSVDPEKRNNLSVLPIALKKRTTLL